MMSDSSNSAPLSSLPPAERTSTPAAGSAAPRRHPSQRRTVRRCKFDSSARRQAVSTWPFRMTPSCPLDPTRPGPSRPAGPGSHHTHWKQESQLLVPSRLGSGHCVSVVSPSATASPSCLRRPLSPSWLCGGEHEPKNTRRRQRSRAWQITCHTHRASMR